jgi:hypothetical protein
MTFISGAQGGIVSGPEVTGHPGALGSLQLSDFSVGGALGTIGVTGATGAAMLDQQGSKVTGGLSLDDPHGPKTVGGVFKPNS